MPYIPQKNNNRKIHNLKEYNIIEQKSDATVVNHTVSDV